ncbi:MAG: DUF2842 domain-containing protein [Sneathiellaceae bacterium]
MHPLIGLFLLLLGLLAYAAIAVTLLGRWFPDGDPWSLLVFAVVGIAWVPVAALLLRRIGRRR